MRPGRREVLIDRMDEQRFKRIDDFIAPFRVKPGSEVRLAKELISKLLASKSHQQDRLTMEQSVPETTENARS